MRLHPIDYHDVGRSAIRPAPIRLAALPEVAKWTLLRPIANHHCTGDEHRYAHAEKDIADAQKVGLPEHREGNDVARPRSERPGSCKGVESSTGHRQTDSPYSDSGGRSNWHCAVGSNNDHVEESSDGRNDRTPL